MTTRGADAPFYSGKAHHHGMNVQVIAGPLGELLWASPALPGASHDIACARTHGLPKALEQVTAFGTTVLADRGYIGVGHGIRVPIMALGRTETGAFRRRELSENEKAYNGAHARMRAYGERSNAQLKSWRVLTRLRCSPERATTIVAAVATLITSGQPGSWKWLPEWVGRCRPSRSDA